MRLRTYTGHDAPSCWASAMRQSAREWDACAGACSRQDAKRGDESERRLGETSVRWWRRGKVRQGAVSARLDDAWSARPTSGTGAVPTPTRAWCTDPAPDALSFSPAAGPSSLLPDHQHHQVPESRQRCATLRPRRPPRRRRMRTSRPPSACWRSSASRMASVSS
jgi:hypothetical protein